MNNTGIRRILLSITIALLSGCGKQKESDVETQPEYVEHQQQKTTEESEIENILNMPSIETWADGTVQVEIRNQNEYIAWIRQAKNYNTCIRLVMEMMETDVTVYLDEILKYGNFKYLTIKNGGIVSVKDRIALNLDSMEEILYDRICSINGDLIGELPEYAVIENKQYSLCQIGDEYEVKLFDQSGNVVYSMMYPKQPWIGEVAENVLEIGVSTGSPSRYTFYFDKTSGKSSMVYFNPILIGDRYVGYMENEKLIITDLFQEELNLEIARDFSPAVNPVTNIEMLDSKTLRLHYYRGENFIEAQEDISIQERIKNE